MIKVAIDTRSLRSGHKVRGIGVHTKELILELEKLSNKDIEISPVDFDNVDLSKYDITHYTSFNPYFISIPFEKYSKKIVLTIHDLIYLLYPKHYPSGLKGGIKFLLQQQYLKQVDAIITISETSKKDICRFLKIEPEKVFVTPLSPKPIFRKISDMNQLKDIKIKYDLPEKFVLYVGDINYNKNLPTLIDACKIAKTPLIIVGKKAKDLVDGGTDDLKSLSGPMDWVRYVLGIPHPEIAHYKKLIRKMDSDNVTILGFIEDEELVKIFNLATLYCQPSFYEGFGLTILEAMACGIPVVASKTQALVEVGGSAALFVEPNDTKGFADKFKVIKKSRSIRDKMIKVGFQNVKNFSWSKTAKKTIDVYKTII